MPLISIKFIVIKFLNVNIFCTTSCAVESNWKLWLLQKATWRSSGRGALIKVARLRFILCIPCVFMCTNSSRYRVTNRMRCKLCSTVQDGRWNPVRNRFQVFTALGWSVHRRWSRVEQEWIRFRHGLATVIRIRITLNCLPKSLPKIVVCPNFAERSISARPKAFPRNILIASF